MSEDLRSRLGAYAGTPSPTDPAQILRKARARRRRRHATIGVAAVLVIGGSLAALVSAFVGDEDTRPVSVDARGTAPSSSLRDELRGVSPPGWLHLGPHEGPQRVAGAAGVTNTTVLVYGGRDPDGNSLASAAIVDLETGQLQVVAAPFGSGENSAVAVIGDDFLICCGDEGTSAAVLDAGTGEWVAISDPPGVFKTSPRGFMIDGLVHLIGERADSVLPPRPDSLATYDPMLDQWELTPLPPDLERQPLAAVIELVATHDELFLHQRTQVGDRLWALSESRAWDEIAAPPVADAALAANASTLYSWGVDTESGATALYEAAIGAYDWRRVDAAPLEGNLRAFEGAFGSATAATDGERLLVWVGGVLESDDEQDGVVAVRISDGTAIDSTRLDPLPGDRYRPLAAVVDELLIIVDGQVHVARMP